MVRTPIPSSIPKNGIYREQYCEKCSDTTEHKIAFFENNQNRETVVFMKYCMVCFKQYQALKQLADDCQMQAPPKFQGRRCEHSVDNWNDLVKIE